ncbi:RnfABCDGE type electron transport complex subunit D [Rhabdothermincola sediminis]|uniref:RnfABCDGE type electron transport complex subunit D n=1 Tax=Rhabdothermincola sediminis TaxID=2751370 RepID=UPI001AA0B067|nr:RnfABCDGE type electron transport complex subunit D [Rhabdothermincola sediminis]
MTAHAFRVGGHEYPVVLPTLRDPRMHLASVIITVQILGQTVLGFELSIAQILVSLGTAAALELAIVFHRQRAVVWPGSALLTANGVALILRVPGTEHGDWWSLHGWYYYAGISAASLLSKYLIRYRGHHVFNPSNIGLVVAFLLLGSNRIEPLDFWWGPMSPGIAAATAVILVGGFTITSRLDLLGMAAGFWITFALSLGIVASTGHCMTATWHLGPICGASFWWVLVTSPEVLIFLFFMITDPKTTPTGRVARVVFGICVGFLAALLVAPQTTEFASKVAVLGSLAIMCVARYPLARVVPAAGSDDDHLRRWLTRSLRDRGDHEGASGAHLRPRLGTVGGGLTAAGICVLALVFAGTPAREPTVHLRPDGTVGSQRDLAVDESTLPPVTISDAMRELSPRLSDRTARLMAADVLADLASERRARLDLDDTAATEGSVFSRLQDLEGEIASVQAGGQIVVPDYTIDRMVIVPVYDPKNAQAGPQFGVEVHGTVTYTTYGGTPPTTGVPSLPEPYERVFALFLSGDRYLLAADYPPGVE